MDGGRANNGLLKFIHIYWVMGTVNKRPKDTSSSP